MVCKETFTQRGQSHSGLRTHSLVSLCQKYNGDMKGGILEMGVCANEGFPLLLRRSGHWRNVSRTPMNIWANSGLTRGLGESLPESGRHRKDAVFWTVHAVPGVSSPEISRACERLLWTAQVVPEKSLPGISRYRKDAAFWTAHENQQKGRRLLHGCPPGNDGFQWLVWRNDHRRRRQ